MATKAKLKKIAAPAPQTREQVDAAIARMGSLQRDIVRLQADMNDELAATKEQWERRAEPMADELAGLLDGVHAWCEANRADLTDHGKRKTANFAAGEVAWRTTPPRVAVRRGISVDTVIELLRARGLGRFIRTKDELNKDAILTEPEAVAGWRELSVEQGEQFAVKPFESAIEAVA